MTEQKSYTYRMQTYLDLLCFILLCFTDAVFCLFFTNGWFVAIPLLNKSSGTTFPAAFGDVVSLCYVSIILTIFQHFFIIIILTMVICDR